MHELYNWWLRRRVQFWHQLVQHAERRLRAAYDRLAEHDSRP